MAYSDNNANSKLAASYHLIGGNPLYDDELRTAPWQIAISDYARCDDRNIIELALDEIKKEHVMLVLTSPSGNRYGNTILINVDDEMLTIDRPNCFDEETVSSFRIYYRDITEVWSFFEVEVINDSPHSLCATYPEVLYRLQRRSSHRVDVPSSTRAVFWQGDEIHNGGEVRNISSAGMLLCTEGKEKKFAENTNIHDIAIALPLSESAVEYDGEGSAVLPVVARGRIVRSFHEEGTGKMCHGVSFSDDNDVIAEIEKFVQETMIEKNDSE